VPEKMKLDGQAARDQGIIDIEKGADPSVLHLISLAPTRVFS
jgi:hypothetical protein